METSKKRTVTRRLTPEEENEREEQDDIVKAAFAISHMMFIRDISKADANNQTLSAPKKRKVVEEDNSEETLHLLLRWINKTKVQHEEIVDVVGRCSKPIRKQLTESDVKEDQNRLMLGKLQVEKMMLPLLKESEIPRGKIGLEVTVYGPDGKVHEMMFKLWNEKTPVLTCGWNTFVAKYVLKKYCDFLTISMFRHVETRKICFAIDSTRLPVKRQLSRKISKIAFKD